MTIFWFIKVDKLKFINFYESKYSDFRVITYHHLYYILSLWKPGYSTQHIWCHQRKDMVWVCSCNLRCHLIFLYEALHKVCHEGRGLRKVNSFWQGEGSKDHVMSHCRCFYNFIFYFLSYISQIYVANITFGVVRIELEGKCLICLKSLFFHWPAFSENLLFK